ncbi:MAG: hypothetical protein NVS1B2_16140 [Vulcanimicrobiaceae bacterium]
MNDRCQDEKCPRYGLRFDQRRGSRPVCSGMPRDRFPNAIGKDDAELIALALESRTFSSELDDAKRLMIARLFRSVAASLATIEGDTEAFRYFTLALEPSDLR